MYQQMGITHESDDSFRAWDKVRGEYLNTMKRLMVLDYENIVLISHEDMSKEHVEPVNDTRAEETPQESPAEGESAPAENADDGNPPMDGAVEVSAPNAQPEQPAEHPRRKRRVREA